MIKRQQTKHVLQLVPHNIVVCNYNMISTVTGEYEQLPNMIMKQ